MKLIVSKIESFATLDGAGIRMAIFLQGCLLRCSYCHNPETWTVCKNAKCRLQNTRPKQNELTHRMYGAKVYKIKQIVEMALKNKPYYTNGGGITFSGGEPLIQSKALAKLCKQLKNNGINVVIDSCGIFNNKRQKAKCEAKADCIPSYVKKVLKYTDEVLFDFKFAADEEYRKQTGGSFKEMMNFLNYLEEIKMPVTAKTVIIPGINDSEESVKQYVEILKPYTCVKDYELLAFHTMGFSKYKELNIVNRLKDVKALDAQILKNLQNYADRFLTEGKDER